MTLDRDGVSLRPDTTAAAVADGKALVLHGPSRPRTGRPRSSITSTRRTLCRDFVAASRLDADGTNGFIAVDPDTLRHRAFRRVWAVGNALAIWAMPDRAVRCAIR